MTSASHTVAMLRAMFEHDDWATGRVVEQMDRLGAAELDEAGDAGAGSLRQTLHHLLDVQWSWIRAIESGAMPGEIKGIEEIPSPGEMWTFHWNEERPRREALLDRLSDDDLRQDVQISTESGQLPPLTVESILLHVTLHSAQHRSELAAMATRHGHSPGELDYLQFVRAGMDAGSEQNTSTP